MIGQNATITTYRLQNSSNTTAWSVTATLSNVSAYIESASPELGVLIDEQQSLEIFNMHIEPADIRPGDKVVTDTGATYYVRNIEKYENNNDTSDIYTVRMTKEYTRYTS